MSIRSIIPHLAAFIVVAGCAWLAQWQVERAGEKREIVDRWNDLDLVGLETLNHPYTLPQPVVGVGNWDVSRQILLDNKIREQVAGVHVLAPLKTADGKIFMVNRGWAPWPSRTDTLPNPALDGSATANPDVTIREVEISGVLNTPPGTGIRLGDAEIRSDSKWPVLVTYFDTAVLSELYGTALQPAVVQLDPDHPAHLTGDAWNVVTFGPERHIGYAMTWASIALVVAGIWLVLSVRRIRARTPGTKR